MAYRQRAAGQRVRAGKYLADRARKKAAAKKPTPKKVEPKKPSTKKPSPKKAVSKKVEPKKPSTKKPSVSPLQQLQKNEAASANAAKKAGYGTGKKAGVRAGMRAAGRSLIGKGPVGTGIGAALMGASFLPSVTSDKSKQRAANRKKPTSRNRMRATSRRATPPVDKGKAPKQRTQGAKVPVIKPKPGPFKVRPKSRTKLDGTETRRRNAGQTGGSSTGSSMRQANVRPRNVTLSKQTGVKKTKAGNYPVYSKKSSAAKSFRSAFADARKSGRKTFTWQGRKYNTKVKKK